MRGGPSYGEERICESSRTDLPKASLSRTRRGRKRKQGGRHGSFLDLWGSFSLHRKIKKGGGYRTWGIRKGNLGGEQRSYNFSSMVPREDWGDKLKARGGEKGGGTVEHTLIQNAFRAFGRREMVLKGGRAENHLLGLLTNSQSREKQLGRDRFAAKPKRTERGRMKKKGKKQVH